jgi:hypothetical protein
MRKGEMTATDWFLAAVIGIALVLFGLYLISISRSGIDSIANYASCLPPNSKQLSECLAPHCANRDGWAVNRINTCKDGLVCCYLEDAAQFYKQGDIILNFQAKDFNLRVQQPQITTSKKGKLFIYYIPRGEEGKPIDASCQLSVNSKPLDPKVENCYAGRGNDIDSVMLWEVDGATLEKEYGVAKGKYADLTFSVSTTGTDPKTFTAPGVKVKLG